MIYGVYKLLKLEKDQYFNIHILYEYLSTLLMIFFIKYLNEPL